MSQRTFLWQLEPPIYIPTNLPWQGLVHRTVSLHVLVSSHDKVLTVIFMLQKLGQQIYADYITEFGMRSQSDASI